MVGRLVASLISDFFSWRLSMAVIGAGPSLVAAFEFWRNLPEPRRAVAAEGGTLALLRGAKPAPARRPKHALAVSAGFFADGRLRQPV
ncbi:hypothetical protein LP419_08885 [Massilia sp. H-1]|nr:hypothetical protein LP419_08885 [Massilia sp. H-1]